MKSKHFLYLFLLFSALQLTAQTGPQPSSMKWKYIENDKVKVIFPENNQTEAIRIADLVTYVNKNATVSVGNKSKKLDILLNTNNAQGNGYVALAPYRSEFYATGFQDFNDLGSMDWLDALAIHEYRHALQFNNANRGFTKFLYLLQGQSGWSLGSNFSIPDWYFEGDAVLAETVLSGAGRGRTPSFFDEQRALLLSDKNYTYLQARNGSFKKLLPNHYPLGYAILNYGRNHFGPEMWPKVLADAGRYRTILYPFAGALRRHTKTGVNKMYKLAYKEMKENWENELESIKLTPTTPITPLPKNTVTNYTFPHWLEDGSILCIKSSFKQISALYKIKDGKQQFLTPIGAATEGYLGVNNNKVAWTEMRKDARRDAVIYSVIMSYDLKTGQRTQVTHKSKFFSPQFSSTGDRIIAVKADENINNELCIISPANGSIVSTIPNPENDFISYPKWTNDDAAIVYLAKRKSKIAMLKYDLARKQTTELTPWTTHVISGLSISDTRVVIGASFSGINNIYAVNLNGDKQITQLSSVRIGATLPAISKDEQKLVMVEMTAMGRQLTHSDVKSIKNIQLTEPVNQERFHIKTTEIEHDIQYQSMDNSYQVKNYKGLLRGVKLHSWNFGSSDGRNVSVGIKLGNILNDFTGLIGAQYNYNEKTVRVNGGFDYGKFFLPLSFRVSAGDRSNAVFLNPNFIGTLSYKQADINVGLSLPLNWIRGNYTTSFRLNSTFSGISTSEYKIQDTPIYHGLEFNALQFGLSFSNIRRKAKQNLVNKWSQNLALSYQKSITTGTTAERLMGTVGLTTPGLGKNHGLEIVFRGKKELLNNNYLFEDQFLHARGYAAAPGDVETVVSATYSLPLFNIDRGFAGIFFINRARANVFYDYGNIERKFINFKTSQRSYGGEIIFDIKLLNTLGPLGFGLRNSFLLDTDPLNPTTKQRFEFFVASNL
ncbi:hypothetical protein [Emticicia sp. BO119]|uniref:hypothetical protein n=1 Tax=Emticicia sp. BO119 TaxID=2757768 RepID=UPI0015F0F846|nr:hypothetical protein [Emticicia sp. BO119]MBA4850695.1 hypothetical protein [Emticicia sp. BO119]